MVAEAGVHQAIAQIDQQMGASPNIFVTGTTGLTVSGTTVALSHGGESSSGGTATYVLSGTSYSVKGTERPYFVIKSTGKVPLYGPRGIGSDSKDSILRKVTLGGSDRFASRKVEVWMRPVYNTSLALTTDGLITLNNHKIAIDSFNSNDPNRSDPPVVTGGARMPSSTVGKYNVSPYDMNLAHIGTNAQLIEAGNATVYGDALTNGGVVGNSDNIMGTIRDDFYQPLAPVTAPSWPAGTISPIVPSSPSINYITSARTLRGGTKANPARYVVDYVSLSGTGTELKFDFALTDGSPDPTKGYVELYVTNNFKISGNGSSVVVNGMNVKIWVGGNLDITGNGITNQGGSALALSIYGVNPPADESRTFKVAGNGVFYGAIYAPGADLQLSGAGSSGTFVGSIVSKTAFLNGNTHVRYDEAIAGPGIISRFTIASWFEDVKAN